MTLEEIDHSLPEGLHDGLIVSLRHDYAQAVVILELSLYTPEGRRAGELRFEGVFYCAVDPPLPESSFLHPGGLWVTSFAQTSDKLPDELLARLPPNTLHYSIFNRDWYSETHIAASTVAFRWLDTVR
jgi:hypothetical protein